MLHIQTAKQISHPIGQKQNILLQGFLCPEKWCLCPATGEINQADLVEKAEGTYAQSCLAWLETFWAFLIRLSVGGSLPPGDPALPRHLASCAMGEARHNRVCKWQEAGDKQKQTVP